MSFTQWIWVLPLVEVLTYGTSLSLFSSLSSLSLLSLSLLSEWCEWVTQYKTVLYLNSVQDYDCHITYSFASFLFSSHFFFLSLVPTLLGHQSPVSEEILVEIAPLVVPIWEHLGVKLGVPFSKIQEARSDTTTFKAAVLAMFHMWQRQKGREATRKALKQALIDLKYKKVACQYFPNDWEIWELVGIVYINVSYCLYVYCIGILHSVVLWFTYTHTNSIINTFSCRFVFVEPESVSIQMEYHCQAAQLLGITKLVVWVPATSHFQYCGLSVGGWQYCQWCFTPSIYLACYTGGGTMHRSATIYGAISLCANRGDHPCDVILPNQFQWGNRQTGYATPCDKVTGRYNSQSFGPVRESPDHGLQCRDSATCPYLLQSTGRLLTVCHMCVNGTEPSSSNVW